MITCTPTYPQQGYSKTKEEKLYGEMGSRIANLFVWGLGVMGHFGRDMSYTRREIDAWNGSREVMWCGSKAVGHV